jgi:hypothetical protein
MYNKGTKKLKLLIKPLKPKVMKDLFVFILELNLKIYVFGHIYLFWVKRLYPELQKHYLTAKRDVTARGTVHMTSKSEFPFWKNHSFTSKSNFPLWKKHFSTSKSVFEAGSVFITQTRNCIYKHLHIYYAASKSLSIALFIYIKTSLRNSPFLHRNFPMVMRFIYNRKQHVSSRL